MINFSIGILKKFQSAYKSRDRAGLICLFKKFGYDLLFWPAFFIIGFFQIFYLFQAAQYFIPLGDDGVIYFWPVGQFMAQSSRTRGRRGFSHHCLRHSSLAGM